MLTIVSFFSNELTTGLLGSEYTQDDVRYLECAERYSETAVGIIDYNSLEKILDDLEPQGAHDKGIELWYWIISISMLLLKNEVFVRLLNILFAIVSIKCIYDICLILYDTKIAKFASFLYAVLPYPIIFSCFLYKDQFYTMLSLLIIRKAFECAGHIRAKDLIYLIVGLILSQLTRSGLVVLFFIAVMIILYKRGKYNVNRLVILVGFILFVTLLYYVVMLNLESITQKVYAYILSNAETIDSTIGIFEIKNPGQLYRYPFAYLFALVQPLSLSFEIKNWMGLAGILNIVGIPVAIANFYYLLNYKIKKDYFFWITQMLFLITILASLGIIRHQYYLQPFIMMYCAVYLCKCNNLLLWRLSSITAVIMIIFVWMI